MNIYSKKPYLLLANNILINKMNINRLSINNQENSCNIPILKPSYIKDPLSKDKILINSFRNERPITASVQSLLNISNINTLTKLHDKIFLKSKDKNRFSKSNHFKSNSVVFNTINNNKNNTINTNYNNITSSILKINKENNSNQKNFHFIKNKKIDLFDITKSKLIFPNDDVMKAKIKNSFTGEFRKFFTNSQDNIKSFYKKIKIPRNSEDSFINNINTMNTKRITAKIAKNTKNKKKSSNISDFSSLIATSSLSTRNNLDGDDNKDINNPNIPSNSNYSKDIVNKINESNVLIINKEDNNDKFDKKISEKNNINDSSDSVNRLKNDFKSSNDFNREDRNLIINNIIDDKCSTNKVSTKKIKVSFINPHIKEEENIENTKNTKNNSNNITNSNGLIINIDINNINKESNKSLGFINIPDSNKSKIIKSMRSFNYNNEEYLDNIDTNKANGYEIKRNSTIDHNNHNNNNKNSIHNNKIVLKIRKQSNSSCNRKSSNVNINTSSTSGNLSKLKYQIISIGNEIKRKSLFLNKSKTSNLEIRDRDENSNEVKKQNNVHYRNFNNKYIYKENQQASIISNSNINGNKIHHIRSTNNLYQRNIKINANKSSKNRNISNNNNCLNMFSTNNAIRINEMYIKKHQATKEANTGISFIDQDCDLLSSKELLLLNQSINTRSIKNTNNLKGEAAKYNSKTRLSNIIKFVNEEKEDSFDKSKRHNILFRKDKERNENKDLNKKDVLYYLLEEHLKLNNILKSDDINSNKYISKNKAVFKSKNALSGLKNNNKGSFTKINKCKSILYDMYGNELIDINRNESKYDDSWIFSNTKKNNDENHSNGCKNKEFNCNLVSNDCIDIRTILKADFSSEAATKLVKNLKLKRITSAFNIRRCKI